MVTIGMTPSKLRELFSESKDRVDVEEYIEAIEYVHDDGRSRRNH